MNPDLHLGIEVFADQAPDLEDVLQLVGAMPEVMFAAEENGDPHTLYFRDPKTGSVYGRIHLGLASAPGLGQLSQTVEDRAVMRLREELAARMCPRQVAYVAVDDAHSPELITYLSRELPRFMQQLGAHATALLVPCIGSREKAHLLANSTEFPQKLDNALGIMSAA